MLYTHKVEEILYLLLLITFISSFIEIHTDVALTNRVANFTHHILEISNSLKPVVHLAVRPAKSPLGPPQEGDSMSNHREKNSRHLFGVCLSKHKVKLGIWEKVWPVWTKNGHF